MISTHVSVESGKPASLHASVSGGSGPYTYFWTQSGGPQVTLDQTHASAPTFTAPSVTQTVDLIFEVLVTNTQDNTTARATETMTVTAPIPVTKLSVTITASPTTITDVETSKLTSIVTGGVAPYTYQWKEILLGTIQNETSASATFVPTTVDDPHNGAVQLTVTDSNNEQVTSDFLIIGITPGFYVTISGPTRVHTGENIHLTSTVYGGSGGSYEYEWKQENSTTSFPNTKDLTITPSDYGPNPNAMKFYLRVLDIGAAHRWSVQAEIVVGFI